MTDRGIKIVSQVAQHEPLAGAPAGVSGRAARRIRLPKGSAAAALIVIAVVVLIAIFADVLAPHSPIDPALPNRLKPPAPFGGTWNYPLGTDALGRDILSRLIFGARTTLSAAVTALFIAGIIGTFLGLVSGYYGGWTDSLIMRAADAMFAFPMILFALLLAVLLGPSFANVIIVLAVLLWARFARLVRSETLTWKQRDFVAYARVARTSDRKIILQHILPNVVNTITVLATWQVGWAIMVEASLSFLGAGIPPPAPSWGGMVADGREYIATAWWVSAVPGVMILLLVLSINILGDWLRDALDPKLRHI